MRDGYTEKREKERLIKEALLQINKISEEWYEWENGCLCLWRIYISTQMVCITCFEGKTSGDWQMQLKSLHFNENKLSFLLKMKITPVLAGAVTFNTMRLWFRSCRRPIDCLKLDLENEN